jgi:hypothetical protein
MDKWLYSYSAYYGSIVKAKVINETDSGYVINFFRTEYEVAKNEVDINDAEWYSSHNIPMGQLAAEITNDVIDAEAKLAVLKKDQADIFSGDINRLGEKFLIVVGTKPLS